MPNYFRSAGYSNGKLHTGVLAYACDLYNEGIDGPLRTFLGNHAAALGPRVYYRREWRNMDLAIFADDGREDLVAIVEMKVDDFDSWSASLGTYQTERYRAAIAKEFEEGVAFIYITLGTGEFGPAPSDGWEWRTLEQANRWASKWRAKDAVLGAWQEALQFELTLRDHCFRHDLAARSWIPHVRWNLYVFASLIRELRRDRELMRRVGLEAYTVGRRPDTILNFGETYEGVYLEINYDGFLNLKIDLANTPEASRERRIREASREWRDALEEFHPQPPDRVRPGKSRTLAKLDVGLRKDGNHITYKRDASYTARRLRKIVPMVYTEPMG